MMINRLQSKHPEENTLRIFVLDSGDVTENLRKLFPGTANASTVKIHPLGGFIVPTISHVIFSESLSLAEANCGTFQNSSMTYMAGIFTTVANENFGVKAG